MRLLKDLVGQTLSNRYQLVARIAGGGMGEVYRGHDLLLDRPIAVKVLQPSLATDADLVARFRAEARAAARLNHPNVVAVHDWGSEDERTYYMVMEYVAGTDLRDIVVGRGPLDPAHAAEVGIAICDALHAAHSTGLVHRDVKPENVLVAKDGTVKVADFGIASVIDAERTLPGGNIFGTLRYLSPEQASGSEATFASDIWGAGAILYELLTATSPQGGTGAELLRRRAVEPPEPPSSLEPGVPPELDEIVLKACSVDPVERFESASDMAEALRFVAIKLAPQSRPVRELLVDVTDEIRLPDMTPTEYIARKESKANRRRSVGGRLIRLLLVLAVLAALGAGGWAAAETWFFPQELPVPKLTGLSEREADAAADDSEFGLVFAEPQRSETVEEGNVISQNPEEGVLLEEGETIEVILSKGPPLVRPPKLEGLSLKNAKKKIKERDLVFGGATREFSLDVKAGRVIEQSVGGKMKVEKGTSIELVVSKGRQMFEVPPVSGLGERKATRILTASDFGVIPIDVFSDTVPVGKVVGTSPAANSEAPEASAVELYISIGPEFKEFKMPNVIGMEIKKARAELEKAGLIVRVTNSCEGKKVRDTDPQPGKKVREQDEVFLFVCG
jgi:serine/threonine-protein kinase